MIGWIAAKWIHALCLRLARRAEVDEALARFLSALAQYAVLAVAVIAALSKVGVQTTSLVALFGAAGLAVGLALQGNLSNFTARGTRRAAIGIAYRSDVERAIGVMIDACASVDTVLEDPRPRSTSPASAPHPRTALQ